MKYNARTFLEGLYSATDTLQLSATQPEDLPAEWRVEWEERAAIREYDGGQAREHAEAEAMTEIVARMRAAGEWT